MFGKAYETMYTGSMVGSGINVFAVWNYVIAMTHFGVIELNPRLLALVLGGPEKEVSAAIEFLCKPDPESRCKLEDGRRLIREGQFQYRVVNWAAYQELRTANDLRQYNRNKMREWRAKKKAEQMARVKGRPLPGERAYVAAVNRGDANGAEAISESTLPEPEEVVEDAAELDD
jgi:hypothetical protein